MAVLSDGVSLGCRLVYVERNGRMISKDRNERDGLTSFVALPRHMIGGTEVKHEILELTHSLPAI